MLSWGWRRKDSVYMSETQMQPIVIRRTHEKDGTRFSLEDESRSALRTQCPQVSVAKSLFISYETESDYKAHMGSFEKQVVVLLCGRVEDALKEAGFTVTVDDV